MRSMTKATIYKITIEVNSKKCLLPLVTYTIKLNQLMYPHVGPHAIPPTAYQ